MGIRSIKINLSKIPESAVFVGKTGDRYITLDELDKREPDQFGRDISLSINQTREERESGASKVFVGDGKWIYRDKPSEASPQKDRAPVASAVPPPENDDLPF